MKIPANVIERMRAVIAPLDTAERRERYRNGDYPRSNQTHDIEKRYRWDLLWHSGAHIILWGYDPFHEILDSHIDTALRRIVSPLQEEK